MNTFMIFDKEAAQKAGGGDYVTETGGYVGLIKAKAITAGTGSKGIEFEMLTKEGLKANYIQIYFEKANGEKIKSGYGHLQSLMGLLKVGQLEMPVDDGEGNYWIKEFCGKLTGFFLQKRLYTKTNGSGEDGYDFQLRAVFNPDTLQTYKEQSNGTEAQRIPYMDQNTKGLDERKSCQPQQNQQSEPEYDF